MRSRNRSATPRAFVRWRIKANIARLSHGGAGVDRRDSLYPRRGARDAAFVLATTGRVDEACALIDEVRGTTAAVEAAVLSSAVDAVVALERRDGDVTERITGFEFMAFDSGALDLLVLSYRASPELLARLLREAHDPIRFSTLISRVGDGDLAHPPVQLNYGSIMIGDSLVSQDLQQRFSRFSLIQAMNQQSGLTGGGLNGGVGGIGGGGGIGGTGSFGGGRGRFRRWNRHGRLRRRRARRHRHRHRRVWRRRLRNRFGDGSAQPTASAIGRPDVPNKFNVWSKRTEADPQDQAAIDELLLAAASPDLRHGVDPQQPSGRADQRRTDHGVASASLSSISIAPRRWCCWKSKSCRWTWQPSSPASSIGNSPTATRSPRASLPAISWPRPPTSSPTPLVALANRASGSREARFPGRSGRQRRTDRSRSDVSIRRLQFPRPHATSGKQQPHDEPRHAAVAHRE